MRCGVFEPAASVSVHSVLTELARLSQSGSFVYVYVCVYAFGLTYDIKQSHCFRWSLSRALFIMCMFAIAIGSAYNDRKPGDS